MFDQGCGHEASPSWVQREILGWHLCEQDERKDCSDNKLFVDLHLTFPVTTKYLSGVNAPDYEIWQAT